MSKHFLMAIFFLFTGYGSFAQYTVQSKYFVYLQTEPAQPFYIKIDKQTLKANSSGYLILPQIKNGDYKLIVGFPDNKMPEMAFNFKMDSKDKGYLIKNMGVDGWSLFDLQTMAVQKSLSVEEAVVKIPIPKKTEPKKELIPVENVTDFTKVLSKATNDSSLLEKPKEIEKPVAKLDPLPAVTLTTANTDMVEDDGKKEKQPATVMVESDEAGNLVNKPLEKKKMIEENNSPQASKNIVKNANALVVKLSQNETKEGLSVLYEDRTEDRGNQQIHITIPEAKKNEQSTSVMAAPTNVLVTTTPEANSMETTGQLEKEEGTKRKRFKVKEKVAIKEKTGKPIDAVEQKVMSENCKNVADENDFLALRRNMASEDNDDKMISEAKKAFKNKCYTTAQIKYLSSMFLSNAGKYHLYETAMGHIADPENFVTLKSEIKESYYQDKFEEMLKK